MPLLAATAKMKQFGLFSLGSLTKHAGLKAFGDRRRQRVEGHSLSTRTLSRVMVRIALQLATHHNVDNILVSDQRCSDTLTVDEVPARHNASNKDAVVDTVRYSQQGSVGRPTVNRSDAASAGVIDPEEQFWHT